jgi:hypothetical protein
MLSEEFPLTLEILEKRSDWSSKCDEAKHLKNKNNE